MSDPKEKRDRICRQYNSRKWTRAVNRAVRREMVMGAEVMIAVELAHKIHDQLRRRGLAGTDEAQDALDAMRGLRDLMQSLVLDRYGDPDYVPPDIDRATTRLVSLPDEVWSVLDREAEAAGLSVDDLIADWSAGE